MKRANTVPSPGAQNGAQNGPQTVSNDATPKGRYKSVLLTPRRGLPSCSTLTPGFLRSFGFANTKSSSQPGMCANLNPICKIILYRLVVKVCF